MSIKLIIKSGLAVGTVYYMRDQGVWGNSIQTEKLYNEMKTFACPYVKKVTKQVPFDVPALPKSGEVQFLAKHYYNQGVKGSIRFIYMLPCYAGQLMKKSKNAIEKALNTSQT